jgi:hypothetical protein
LVATTESYDKTKTESNIKAQTLNLEARAKLLFQGREGFEIFANLGSDTIDIDILKKYREITISEFRTERRGDFSKATPQEKSNTMGVYLALQMAQRNMNKLQLAFILEAKSLASTEMYSATKGTILWEKINQSLTDLSDRMLEVFQKEEALEIFMSIGGKDGTPPVNPLRPALCSCATNSDYCGWWHSGATCGTASCNYTIGGCGTLLGQDCNGGCQAQ